MTQEALDQLSQFAQIYRDLCERNTVTTKDIQLALDRLEQLINMAVQKIEIERNS